MPRQPFRPLAATLRRRFALLTVVALTLSAPTAWAAEVKAADAARIGCVPPGVWADGTGTAVEPVPLLRRISEAPVILLGSSTTSRTTTAGSSIPWPGFMR